MLMSQVKELSSKKKTTVNHAVQLLSYVAAVILLVIIIVRITGSSRLFLKQKNYLNLTHMFSETRDVSLIYVWLKTRPKIIKTLSLTKPQCCMQVFYLKAFIFNALLKRGLNLTQFSGEVFSTLMKLNRENRQTCYASCNRMLIL